MNNTSEEQLLKILSNPIRATIVKKLYDDSLTFTHLMQLTGCKTGQLSFHIKKLDYLVEQDELKRYRLSEKGKEDVEAILPRLGNPEKENCSFWNNSFADKEDIQLSYAFKEFWDSLGFLILSFLATLKHATLGILGGLKSRVLKISTKTRGIFATAKTHLNGDNSGVRTIFQKGKIELGKIKSKTGSFFSLLLVLGVSALKKSRKALNPIFCYSFLILGLLLFIPSMFSLVHPSFGPTLDSAAKIGLTELSPEEISFVNNLYEKEMLPNQRNFQGNSDSLMYSALYYEDTVGFPLSVQKIEAWNEAKAKARVHLVKDYVLSGLSISIVFLLLGGVMTYRRNALLKALNSTITASVILILVAVFGLLNINAILASNSGYPESVFNSIPLMLKHLIALLLLILFLSIAGTLFIRDKKEKLDKEKKRERDKEEKQELNKEENQEPDKEKKLEL